MGRGFIFFSEQGNMNEKFVRRAKRNDKIARWLITLGGMAIIFSVVFILILIVKVALPLFETPSAEIYAKIKPVQTSGEIVSVGIDPYLETGYQLVFHRKY